MKVAHTSITSTDTPQDDRSPADRLAFLAASYVRGQSIPTAAPAPVTVTAEQVREQLAASSDDWTSKPVIPGIPGQTRRSPDAPKPQPKIPGQRDAYTDIVLRYGEHAAHSAF